MGNSVQELFEMLYAMIKDARSLPLSADKCVVERDRTLDLLDEIKAQFPTELAEARRLVDARSEFIMNAKREAETIRKAAEDRAKQLVNENEIYKTARTKSNEMLTSAEKASSELRRVANEYVDDAMRRTEEALSTALDEIRRTRSGFKAASASVAKAPQYTVEEVALEADGTDMGIDIDIDE